MPHLLIDPARCTASDFAPAVAWLRQGCVVAFPTDTSYGLAADPTSFRAVQTVFDVKARPADVALPLIAATTSQVEALCGRLTANTARLAERFWPGPLALILDAPPSLANTVSGGRGSIAIRVPDHPVARQLCVAWGGPLTATSANRRGEPDAVTPRDLGALLTDPRVLVIDAGPAPGGPPSTIVDARGVAIALVRAGAIAWDRVLRSLEE
jgi:L-threonylcarbamoyladenylate synthase